MSLRSSKFIRRSGGYSTPEAPANDMEITDESVTI